jgi:membrane-associated phospholipid phosphatase
MIVATLPEGGHYLVDVIAGAIIGGLALMFVRQWEVARDPIELKPKDPSKIGV